MTRAIAVLSIVVLAACAARQSPAAAPRFESQRYPYAVYFNGGVHGMFASPNWRLTNYDFDGKSFTPKGGIMFEVKRAYDADGDGKAEGEYTEPFYEVALAHRTKDAKLWLRMVPLATVDRRATLAALAERYVQCVAGMGSPVVLFGVERATCSGQHFATRTVRTTPCTVSSQQAVAVDFEVANVAPDRLSEATRWTWARVVLVRTSYERVFIDAQRNLQASFPVLMLAGLSSQPDDFNQLAGDFDHFLGQVALSSKDGPIPATGGHSCHVSSR